MIKRNMWTIVGTLTGLALIAGLAGAPPATRPAAALADASLAGLPVWSMPDAPQDPSAPGATVPSTITYQGRLTDPGGEPLTGTYSMQFRLYDAAAGGTQLFDSGLMSVQVTAGTFDAQLNVSQASFNGQALWLSIAVNSETLSPRQALHPAPYALGLKPGAYVTGAPATSAGSILSAELASGWPAGSAVAGFAPATGSALYAEATGGHGLTAHSNSNYGISGSSANGAGGYFTSQQGYGIRVSTTGTDHWDHGAYITATSGYAILATSNNNMAIRGQAGNMTDLWQPVGHVGVVGIGQSRGVYGSAKTSYGVYGTSLDWYGVYGRTSRTDNNYGVYTPDNLFAANTTLAGAIMNVVQNGGDAALEPGDVAVFSGMSEPLQANGTRVPQVSQAAQANSQAVAGVVYSRFNIAVFDLDESDADPPPGMEVTPAGAVAPGEYMLLVVQGPAQVKASAVGGSIGPGDLLSTAASDGAAGRSQAVTLQGVEMALPGTVFGKALEPLEDGQDLIYIWVSPR